MSSSPPPFNPSSSPARPSEPPLRSNGLLTNPTARAYLVPRAASGRDILVTVEEARQWFQHGYTILDPISRQPVDIGPVPIPAYSQGQGAFVREEENERKVRNAHAKDEVKKGGNDGRNGYSNGGSGAASGGAAA